MSPEGPKVGRTALVFGAKRVHRPLAGQGAARSGHPDHCSGEKPRVGGQADALGVALTVVNPPTVIGHSVTGESDQRLGLATTVLDLLAGRLRAISGGPQTFVPVVTADHLARFMALLSTVEEAAGESYLVLEDDTPALPDLLRIIGEHHRVRVPWLRIPVGVVNALPVALTRADPETLSFLSTDRYPIDFQDTLEDSAASRDLVAQLPQTIEMRDHGGVEKTGRLSAPLSLDGQSSGADPDVGDVGCYAPGHDFVLYYGDQSYFEGIVVLGRLDDDAADRIAQFDGSVFANVDVLG